MPTAPRKTTEADYTDIRLLLQIQFVLNLNSIRVRN